MNHPLRSSSFLSPPHIFSPKSSKSSDLLAQSQTITSSFPSISLIHSHKTSKTLTFSIYLKWWTLLPPYSHQYIPASEPHPFPSFLLIHSNITKSTPFLHIFHNNSTFSSLYFPFFFRKTLGKEKGKKRISIALMSWKQEVSDICTV